MKPADNINKLIKKLQLKASAKLDERIHGEISRALKESDKTKSAKLEPKIWRIIMKSRITKLAAAAVILFAVLIGIHHFGGSIDGASVAWAELVQRVEQSHDEYMEELLLATKEKDTEKVNFYSHLLEEFWQKLGWLARAELHPERRARILAEIAGQKAEEREESDQIGIRIFLEYADQFSDWLGKIEDVTWINETIHVCKQMEEYAEEIRDAARSEDGLPYIEHCMPSFLAYSGWFKQLPWDDPSEHIGLDVLLTAIQRDLEIARWEILYLKNHDADRFVKRCVNQTKKNVLEVGDNAASNEMENQWKLHRKLTRRIDELSDLMTYATVAAWGIQQTDKIHQNDEAFRLVLTRDFGDKGPLTDYLLKQIDQSLDLCEQLLAELESEQ